MSVEEEKNQEEKSLIKLSIQIKNIVYKNIFCRVASYYKVVKEKNLIEAFKNFMGFNGQELDNQDKNASPKSVFLVWFSAIAIVILIIWAGFAEIDQTVRGIGKVVPSQRVQLIQNLEGGIVQELPVKEGQIVDANAVVMRIENETADSQYREASLRALEHEACIARLEALIKNEMPEYNSEVMAIPELVHRQNDLFFAEQEQSSTELKVLALQVQSRKRKLAEQEEHQAQTKASLVIVRKQYNLALPAMKSKAFSNLEFLDIENRLQALKADLAILKHSIPRAKTDVEEAEEKLRLCKAKLISGYRKELSKVQVKLMSLQELLIAGSDKVKRTEMRSPVRGIIKSIYTNTVGGVVKPGATVMEIVPLDDSLIIEAKFNPSDIAFIYLGQKAKVRLTAYDFSIYGGMDATVEQISADTLSNNKGDTFYQVKVITKSSSLQHEDKSLPIMVGMMAEVDILTGKKTILDYILKPIFKAQQRALRER